MDISDFQFINVSHHTCHLEGYPGVAADNAAGRQFALKVTRENLDATRIESVSIAPGGRASFKVQSVVPGFQQGRCVSSYRMLFTPPNDYSTLSIRRSLLFCAGGILIGPVEKSD
jgi:hypothetical protein